MKALFSFLVIASLVLAACSSSGEPGSASSVPMDSPTTPPPAPASQTPAGSGSGESLADYLDQATATPVTGKGLTGSQLPEIDWDRSPEALIISVTNCCGFVPEFVTFNYLPEAQVWGNGMAIWTQFGPNNERQVLTGQLTEEQMSGLLQRAAKAGFFGWEELYTSAMAPSDLPTMCISIQLESQNRRVCEYYEGAPAAFHDLYTELDSGLGLTGQDYSPEEAYLTSALEGSNVEGQFPEWDPQASVLSLSQATSGTWVEGQALETAWQLVNANPFGTAVKEGENLYRISLQISGVSLVAPPPR